jgi:hypothetical protein
MKDLVEIYKWPVGHFFVTRLLRDVFTSRSCRAVSPFLSFIFCFFSCSPQPLAAHYRKNYKSYHPETFCAYSRPDCGYPKGIYKSLTHDLDLHGVKVTFYIWLSSEFTAGQIVTKLYHNVACTLGYQIKQ